MKMPSLKTKSKFKRHKGNIHFGKVVLTFMLVGTMALGCVESVKASEPLYYYDRYRAHVSYEEKTVNTWKHPNDSMPIRAGERVYWELYPGDVTIKWNGDKVTIRGERYSEYSSNAKFNGYWYYVLPDSKSYYKIWNHQSWYKTCVEKTSVRTESRGSYIDTVTGTYSQYPSNGIQGSYWYVRKGLVNNNPTLSIATPSENSYFGKEKSINISGTVRDQDSGDTLTIKYTINGILAHTNKTLQTITANGSDQSFSNDIFIDTSIPEGSYDLKVWVEDNNGGKSSEVTRNIGIDYTNPTLTLSQSPTNWTNNEVTITAKASDNLSGVKRIRRPDGTWVSSLSTTYTVSSNGTYTFTVEDNAGNTTTESIEINNIDKISPTVDITDNDNNWHKSFTVNISHSDDGGSGIKTRRYSITNNTTKPTSGWIDLTSEDQGIDILTNGNNYVHVQVIDNAGNETYEYKGPFKIDKTPPILNDPVAEAISSSEIKISVDAEDNLSGLDAKPYLYNRDGIDITGWISSNTLVDNNLIANKQYSYKYKAKDSLENISDYSSEVKRYTLALDPVRVWFVDSSDTSVTLEIEHNTENANIPEVRIVLKEKGTSNIVSTSNWNTEITRVLTGLQAGKEYEVYLTTRNGDNIENPEIKAPLVDTEENPIDYVVTVVPVSNFRVIESSVNSLTVSWDQVYSQEYQVYLKDELGNEIPNTRSNWIADDTYTFSNLPLPNTKYVPYIITRKVNSTIHLPEKKVLKEEKAYTNAEGISRGTFESGEDYITIRLNVEDTRNPNDTEYFIKNDITGQPEVKVTHANPVWKNTNLAKESYYTYSVRVVNKNGEDSYYTRLVFENGEAHTLIPDLDIEPGNIIPDNGDFINLDDLKEHDLDQPIWFNPEEDLNNNIVQLESEKYRVTRNRIEVVENHEEIEVINYSYSREGFGYTEWKPLEKGKFKEKLIFNTPGIYRTHWKFKNYNIESKPVIINYYADWIEPSIDGESAIKGQTAVTGNEFGVRINAKDNISPYLFYSIDDGKTWYLLKEGQNEIVFTNIKKSLAGVQNKLTVKVADIAGNVIEKTFTVWGIEK